MRLRRVKKLAAGLGFAVALLAAGPSLAQQGTPLDGVVHPSWLGVWSTSGCGSGQTSCFVPWTAGNPLPVTGTLSLAGTTSNATSGVATSATNIPTVSYNYGFNGVTWDQLQVDGSKNLKTVVGGTLPAFAVVPSVKIDQTTPGTTNAVQVLGNAGTVAQTSVSVTNASTALLTAAQFTNFEKICVALTATTGVWVNWANAAAVAASPSEYIPPGQCDSWVRSTGFMPTAAAFAISNSASTIAVTVEGN